MLLTPLEQFQIISLLSVKVFCFDFSLTNMLFVNVIVLFIFSSIVAFFSSTKNTAGEFFLIPQSKCEGLPYCNEKYQSRQPNQAGQVAKYSNGSLGYLWFF